MAKAARRRSGPTGDYRHTGGPGSEASLDSAQLPASLGPKADAASLSVTQSTEDKAARAAEQDANDSKRVVIHKSDGTALEYNDLIETKVVRPPITVDTAVYADNDCIGGKITLSNFARVDQGSGVLSRLQLRTVLNMASSLHVHIFDADPTFSTLTDNAAVVIHVDDRAKILKTITVAASGDWVAPKGQNPHYTFECIDPTAGRLMIPYQLASGRSLFLAFEAGTGTDIDFVAATDLSAIVAAENN